MKLLTIAGYLILLFFAALYTDLPNVNPSGTLPRYIEGPAPLFMLMLLLVSLLGTETAGDFLKGLAMGFGFRKPHSKSELQKSLDAMRHGVQTTLLSGGILFLIGVISMLYRLDLPSTIGPVLALGCLSLLYALIFALLLSPLQMRLRQSLTALETVSDEKEQPDRRPEDQKIYFLLRSKGLTDREAEVARLIGQGGTNKELAEELCISEFTVKKHVTHILEKLQLDNREAIASFIEEASSSQEKPNPS